MVSRSCWQSKICTNLWPLFVHMLVHLYWNITIGVLGAHIATGYGQHGSPVSWCIPTPKLLKQNMIKNVHDHYVFSKNMHLCQHFVSISQPKFWSKDQIVTKVAKPGKLIIALYVVPVGSSPESSDFLKTMKKGVANSWLHSFKTIGCTWSGLGHLSGLRVSNFSCTSFTVNSISSSLVFSLALLFKLVTSQSGSCVKTDWKKSLNISAVSWSVSVRPASLLSNCEVPAFTFFSHIHRML